MARLASLALLAILAAGCFDSGTHAGSSPSSASVTVPPPPKTRIVVTYTLGPTVARRSELPACPPGATCRTVLASANLGSHRWILVEHRRLTCSPAGGGYADPARACRALGDLRRVLKARHGLCFCPMIMPYTGMPQTAARGVVGGRRMVIPLDFCTLCGLGQRAAADARVLMP
jgi:hypothetical protein